MTLIPQITTDSIASLNQAVRKAGCYLQFDSVDLLFRQNQIEAPGPEFYALWKDFRFCTRPPNYHDIQSIFLFCPCVSTVLGARSSNKIAVKNLIVEPNGATISMYQISKTKKLISKNVLVDLAYGRELWNRLVRSGYTSLIT